MPLEWWSDMSQQDISVWKPESLQSNIWQDQKPIPVTPEQKALEGVKEQEAHETLAVVKQATEAWQREFLKHKNTEKMTFPEFQESCKKFGTFLDQSRRSYRVPKLASHLTTATKAMASFPCISCDVSSMNYKMVGVTWALVTNFTDVRSEGNGRKGVGPMRFDGYSGGLTFIGQWDRFRGQFGLEWGKAKQVDEKIPNHYYNMTFLAADASIWVAFGDSENGVLPWLMVGGGYMHHRVDGKNMGKDFVVNPSAADILKWKGMPYVGAKFGIDTNLWEVAKVIFFVELRVPLWWKRDMMEWIPGWQDPDGMMKAGATFALIR